MRYINLPVKPYVKRFLEYEYGSPIVAQRKTLLGNKLYDVLRRKYFNQPLDRECYSETITIYFPPHIFRDAGCFIKPEGIVNFNTFFWLLIKERWRMFIHCRVLLGWEITDAINAFLKEYKVELDFEVIKKDYYRWRLDYDKYIFPSNVPPLRNSSKTEEYALIQSAS